jgi:hypothetical protein
MGFSAFPKEVRRLALLEAELVAACTLEEIERIEGNIFPSSEEGQARELFSQCAAKKEELVKRKITLLEGESNLVSKMESLMPLMFYLSPAEMEIQFNAIELESSLLSNKDRKVQERVLKDLKHLRFREKFRIVDDLERSGPDAFSVGLQKVAEDVLETNSLDALQALSPHILREILRGEGASPEGAAHAIEEYLKALRVQAKAAEDFYYGAIGEGMEILIGLPDSIRLKVDQLIWEAAGGEAIDPTDEANAELIAGAILHSLEERMGVA